MSLEERIRQSVGNAVDEVRARIEGRIRVRVRERKAEMAGLSRLVEALRGLDSATTVCQPALV